MFTELSAQSLSIGRWYGEAPASSSAALEGAVDELTVLHRDIPFNGMNTTRINQQDPADTYTLGEENGNEQSACAPFGRPSRSQHG